jgi:hypothetical protein
VEAGFHTEFNAPEKAAVTIGGALIDEQITMALPLG